MMQSGTKLIATPEGKDGKHQILYTSAGKPCESLQDIANEYTKTEQELLGQKIRPTFNKKYIEAEIPAVVQVPVDQRWSREIDFWFGAGRSSKAANDYKTLYTYVWPSKCESI